MAAAKARPNMSTLWTYTTGLYSGDAARHSGRAAGPRAGRPRRLAALRLPGIEPGRHAAVRSRVRREDDDPPLVLPGAGHRGTARPCARHRALQPGRAPRDQAAVRGT